ncbi:MAG: peptidylprolyl isomerase [Bacteroidetes bacterium]|nr:peptidylprolyl isomerase [Bacteroidota bacterium]
MLTLIVTLAPVSKAQSDFKVQLNELKNVWNATAQRDTSALFAFSQNQNTIIADAAMRGLTNMQLTDIPRLLSYTTTSVSELWYLPLTTHELDDEQIKYLMVNVIEERPLHDLYSILGSQSSQVAHNILLDQLSRVAYLKNNPAALQALGLALSRSSMRFEIDETYQLKIARLALHAEMVAEQASWLYGWYRNVAVTLYPKTLSYLQNELPELWPELHGLSRQYLIAALGRNSVEWLTTLLTDEYLRHIHPLEAIEITRVLPAIMQAGEQRRLIKALFQHENAMVRTLTYRSLTSLETDYSSDIPEPAHIAHLHEKMAYLGYKITFDKSEACKIITSQDMIDAVLDFPTTADAYIPLLSECQQGPELYATLKNLVSSDSSHSVLQRFVLNSLASETSTTPDFVAVLERIAQNNAPQLHTTWVMLADVHGNTIQESEPLTDRVRLAREEELVRSDQLLKADIEVIERLGPRPMWIITTQRGELHIRLDPLRSPSTITAIAQLVDNRSHLGSPFHRIVPNFVIQAGELWVGNTGGSPAFRVPTEASEKSFNRGALGIASAGRDTEGSQFFIMHMWAPRLDGRYTNAGYLTEGYDVLDGLMQGDVILGSYLIPTVQ